MATKTNEEIAAEIAALEEIKPNVRAYNAFEDSNRDAIQAQIDVLNQGLSADDVNDRWPEDEGSDPYNRDHALEAIDWRDGDRDAAGLAASWQSLVIAP